ncbi:MAG: guanylate kinase [Desulfuromonadaceae bacterium]|nr:guanylate kinase [Desulfuromonadaceae bacterium]MDD2855693.1 guanylate kinase [Desulfuromonadaceae bacterium]
MKREGLILILSAPSGAGKTSLCRELFKTFPDIKESVSYTTRAPRPAEIEGQAYHFVSNEEFEKMVAEDAFAEWAFVHGNMYGTALSTLEEARKNGIDLILDIDCQGALKLKEQFDGGVYVFIMPPSMGELRRRLEGRSSDAQEIIERRILRAAEEIKEARWYDYIIINDDFSIACRELAAILIAHRRKTFRMLEKVGKLFDI